MAARVHRIGTIYSRINGLIQKGHMKESDKPIWFDVYKNFPPKYEPTFKRKTSETEVREILYEEDFLRAKIHKALGSQLGVFDLSKKKDERMLTIYQQYISEGCTEDEAIEKLKSFGKGPIQRSTEKASHDRREYAETSK